jgi:predicted DNA-binding transcriptional regulator AlpA
VRRRTSLSNSTIDRREKAGTFPVRIQLNPEIGPQGGIGYFEDEIDQWIIDRIRGIGRPLPIRRRNAGAGAAQ